MNEQDLKLINQEIKGCFDFFWYESNDKNTNAFGLTIDKTRSKYSSLAAVGFAFNAYIIGVENKFITFDEGYQRTYQTIETLKKIKCFHGFFPHFVELTTGLNIKSEYSTIDSAILFCGLITAAEYFGGDVKEEAYKIVNNADWEHFLKEHDGHLQFNMAYSDYHWEKTNHYCPAYWDQYAEQLMIYLIYAGRKDVTSEKAKEVYHGFTRHHGIYHDKDVVHCYGNALFTHQFTHAFFNFKEYLDDEGFDWYQNSVNATLCNKEYCLELASKFKTYSVDSWGLSAFQGRDNYHAFGAPPYGIGDNLPHHDIDGSVTPYASLCSIVFTEDESLRALRYFNTIEGLNGKYGLSDCYNFDQDYISDVYVGIDKGPTIIMLDNYLHGTTWKYFMQSPIIQSAISKLGFKKR